MEGNTERTPLLPSALQHSEHVQQLYSGRDVHRDLERAASSSSEEAVDDDNDLSDASLHELAAATYSTSVPSLGLDGGSYGVPFGLRRGSIVSNRRLSQVGRRNSRRLILRPDQRLIGGFTSQSDDVAKNSKSTVTTIENIAGLSEEYRKSDQDEFLGSVSRGRFWAVFASILLLYFVGLLDRCCLTGADCYMQVACFDSTLMASSHPVITSYFHASNSASWLTTAFLLTSTALQPVFGRISDSFGRRIPFLVCIFVFGAATLWCAVAPTISSFIFARAACGLGAGGAMALGAIINSDIVPLRIRGKYQALLNMAYGIGSSVGAATGGYLADNLGWRWEFGIQG